MMKQFLLFCFDRSSFVLLDSHLSGPNRRVSAFRFVRRRKSKFASSRRWNSSRNFLLYFGNRLEWCCAKNDASQRKCQFSSNKKSSRNWWQFDYLYKSNSSISPGRRNPSEQFSMWFNLGSEGWFFVVGANSNKRFEFVSLREFSRDEFLSIFRSVARRSEYISDRRSRSRWRRSSFIHV